MSRSNHSFKIRLPHIFPKQWKPWFFKRGKGMSKKKRKDIFLLEFFCLFVLTYFKSF